MLGLAIDSAKRSASAAIWRFGAEPIPTSGGRFGARHAIDPCATAEGGRFEVFTNGTLSTEAGRADQLITVIERLLGEQNLDYTDLDVIAVNRGPGSFTGIRSAVALSCGVALAAGIPVIGVTSHETLAALLASDEGGDPLLVALDARRGEVYTQAFTAKGEPMSDIETKAPSVVVTSLAAGRWRVTGDGARLLPGTTDLAEIETKPIDAGAVARAAARRLWAGEVPVQGSTLRPLYVRAPDAVPPAPMMSTTARSEGQA